MPTRIRGRAVVLSLLSCLACLNAQNTSTSLDSSPHKVQMITVGENVQLEVLDWGGAGRSIILLSGLGNTAHIFDDFALKLIPNYHVFGITRRGFGASSKPASGYDADRLGDDVLAVAAALKLSRPVLAGHSIAGEELSSIGSRHPDSVAGLVYLDAAYPYAFDNGKGWGLADMREVQKNAPNPTPPGAADVANPTAFGNWVRRTTGAPYPQGEILQLMRGGPPNPKTSQAIMEGAKKFVEIPVPALAIYASPHDESATLRAVDPSKRAEMEDLVGRFEVQAVKQIAAFKSGVLSARVVTIANAHHYLFLSNESDVLREMKTFLSTLK